MTDNRLLIRTSERLDFAACRMRWKWGYIDKLRPRHISTALTFGDLIHQALAAYYIPEKGRRPGRKPRRGPHPADWFEETYEKLTAAGLEFNVYGGEDQRYEAGSLGVAMLINYIDEYGLDEQFEVISPEVPFAWDVYHQRSGRYLFTYVGQGDAVVRDLHTGKLGMFEHKTTRAIGVNRQLPNHYLPMDEQSGSYWTYLPFWLRQEGWLKPGQDLDFILFNFLRKAPPDVRPQDAAGHYLNKNGSISKQQPAPLFMREIVRRSKRDRVHLHERVKQQVREMNMIRQGKVLALKSPGRECKMCAYRDMCEVHEAGGDWEFIRDHQYTVWEPYEVHESKGEESGQ